MRLLYRLAVVTGAILLCIAIFAAAFELLNGLAMNLMQGRFASPDLMLLPNAVWWALIFRAPGYIYLGTLPLLLLFLALEWRHIQARWAYVRVWAAAGVFATFFPGYWMLHAAPAFLAGGLAGWLYWRLAGRQAGHAFHGGDAENGSRKRLPLRYAAYAVLGYLAFQMLGYAYYGGKLLWVSFVAAPGPGTPPFQVLHEREMTAAKKVAMLDFPDAQSCLEESASDAIPSERLKMMDWIGSTATRKRKSASSAFSARIRISRLRQSGWKRRASR
ncbi:phosphoglycerol transferase MdoB-like AlkP superfamily enzyme [Pseudorhizobium tarimense]|uniref:Phosphoglycerol transferase MdoB-like AlkP superfamily enzyme n=1 Tax=Pseudorhizobium tarimense TaxID=1079109 RepID=A0ABV2H0Z2_9HYPH|nr:hypothetical protein [Pseudorhizobium tarimense]MCJ8517318.1 hypothetical protein [Pseudorhizobium tarimense]